jgi:hypothetical protein
MKRFTFSAFMTVLIASPWQAAYAWGRFEGGYHPYRRSPVIVHNTYVRGGGGCVGCGAAAVVGLVGGALVGAAIVANSQPRTVIVEQPQTVVVAQPAYGTQVAMLPPGCGNMNINGATYYRCNNYWYQPYMGGNGVYYTMVPPPM